MARDSELTERVRRALTGRDVRETKMFGGLAFMAGWAALALALWREGTAVD